MTTDFDELYKDVRELERKNFEVVVEFDRHEKTDVVMSVTHNGRQWTSVSFLSKEEINKAIKAMQEFVDEMEKE